MVDRANIQVIFIDIKPNGKLASSATPFPSIPMAEEYFRNKAKEHDSGRLIVDDETIYVSSLGMIEEV